MAESVSNRARVEIFDSTYVLKGQATTSELLSVARKVDGTMRQIQSANPHLDPKRIAVLTAVNLADEVRKLQAQVNELMAMLDSRTSS